MSLPKYKCHKIVEAFKIKEVIIEARWARMCILVPEDENLESVQVSDEYMAKHNPAAGGYYVRYPDGYESWSPALAFESGYIRIEEEDSGPAAA